MKEVIVKKIQIYKSLIVTFIMVLLHDIAFAQPLPPESPEGNAIFVGRVLVVLLALAVLLGVRKRRKVR